MKIITVSNQKGGVGKTATVVNLAGYFSREHNKTVLVFDLDTQGNASWSLSANEVLLSASNVLFGKDFDLISWGKNNTFNLKNKISLVGADSLLANIDSYDIKNIVSRLSVFLNQIKEIGIDIVIFDTPPSLGKALTSALLVSDYVLCPIELEAYSLQGVKKLQNVISNVRKYNNSLNVLGLLPSLVDNRNKRQRVQLQQIKDLYPNLIIQYPIGLRASVADALSDKVFLGDVKKASAKKAKQEFSTLASWILEKIKE